MDTESNKKKTDLSEACTQCLKFFSKQAFWTQTKALEQCLISVWNSSANVHLPFMAAIH